MNIYKDYTACPAGSTLVLGFFDGMHLGHRKLINDAVKRAKKLGTDVVMLTFSESPALFFSENKSEYKSIYSRDLNYKMAEKFGVNYIYSLDFKTLANISAEEYIKSITEKFSPKVIFSGYNYTFGHNKAGNSVLLKRLSDLYKYEYHCVEPVKFEGECISSTFIKKMLTEGDIKKANRFLGSDFSIKSEVIHGKQLGRKLGFPTANMEYPKGIIKIPHGVYKVNVYDKDAVLNWGIKPTVGENSELMELYIPNFEADLYGKEIVINFKDKIRDEKKFSSLEELKTQIKEDIKKCTE